MGVVCGGQVHVCGDQVEIAVQMQILIVEPGGGSGGGGPRSPTDQEGLGSCEKRQGLQEKKRGCLPAMEGNKVEGNAVMEEGEAKVSDDCQGDFRSE